MAWPDITGEINEQRHGDGSESRSTDGTSARKRRAAKAYDVPAMTRGIHDQHQQRETCPSLAILWLLGLTSKREREKNPSLPMLRLTDRQCMPADGIGGVDAVQPRRLSVVDREDVGGCRRPRTAVAVWG